MKKSELYLYAQKAVCESRLPKSIKLEILDVLISEEMIEKMLEEAEEKKEVTDE